MKYHKPTYDDDVTLLTDAEYDKLIDEERANGNTNIDWERVEQLIFIKTRHMGTKWIDERRQGKFDNQSLQ